MKLQTPLGSLLSLASSLPPWTAKSITAHRSCPKLPPGDLVLRHYQLYPEIFIWDQRRCVAYVSDLYNASLSIYDPYKSEIIQVFSFPGLSHPGDTAVKPLHASGVVLRPDAYKAEYLDIVIDNGDCFYSDGLNVSGPDYLLTMHLDTRTIISQHHLNPVSNYSYAGYADAELGNDGNTYIVGTYASNILRRTPEGQLSTFYVQDDLAPPRRYGYTGLAHVGDALLSNDNVARQLVRFDTKDKVGTPIFIPQTPYHEFNTSNVMSIPERYDDTVLLMAENMTPESPSGGVGVYRSRDKLFHSVEFLGFIPSKLTTALATCARQMSDRIYLVSVYTDGANITVAGHASDFVLQDITADVDALLT